VRADYLDDVVWSLLPLDEPRARMPDHQPNKPASRPSLDSLDAAQIDQESYLKLAENLQTFRARLHDNAEAATIEDRQSATQRAQRSLRRTRARRHPTQQSPCEIPAR
jgi:hypothetical protein